MLCYNENIGEKIMADVENDIDWETERKNQYQELVENVNELFEYFSNPNKDLSCYEDMISYYNKIFYDMFPEFLRYKYGMEHDYSAVLEQFNKVGGLIAKDLCSQQNGEELGHRKVQESFTDKKKLNEQPALMQYLFLKISEISDTPYSPLKATHDTYKAAKALMDNTVQIRGGVGNKNSNGDVLLNNAYLIYALAHETQHIKHRLANPHGTTEEKRTYLYSCLQPLEDGFEKGLPSGHIAPAVKFPDEVKADYDSCPEVYGYLSQEYSFPDDELAKMKDFLKAQQVMLVTNAVDSPTPMLPDDYLDHFVHNYLEDNPNLSASEKERVAQFLKAYESLAESNIEPE